MPIIDDLRFVQGAVARKGYDPALTHFKLSKGKVQSYNGIISLCSPIDIDFDASPKAVPFIRAVQASKDGMTLHMTAGGKLAVRSGPFRAFVECLPDDVPFPTIEPEGREVSLEGMDILAPLRTVEKFIAEDASRQWARGVLFRDQSLFATNNITLVEHWLPVRFPVEINVPQEAVSELLRIKDKPESLLVTENHITFRYASGRWLKSRLYGVSWPNVESLLGRDSAQVGVEDSFFTALETLTPFIEKNGGVYFCGDVIRTSMEEGSGASIEFGVHSEAAFHHSQLMLLRGLAKSIDWSMYPAPCLFYGADIRGVIAGRRV